MFVFTKKGIYSNKRIAASLQLFLSTLQKPSYGVNLPQEGQLYSIMGAHGTSLYPRRSLLFGRECILLLSESGHLLQSFFSGKLIKRDALTALILEILLSLFVRFIHIRDLIQFGRLGSDTEEVFKELDYRIQKTDMLCEYISAFAYLLICSTAHSRGAFGMPFGLTCYLVKGV